MNEANGLHYRDEILAHFRDGTPWSTIAREHYINCLECMTQVTHMLAERADSTSASGCRSADHNGTSSAIPEAAKRAIEHGRKVLAREFGISLGSAVKSE
jgi:hypothetical protein